VSFWTRFFDRHRKEQELDAEIAAHLAIETRERIEQGDSAEQARAGARSDLGSVALVKERTRDVWGWTWFERLLRDQRYILRHLGRNPGFAAVSIFVLAVGLAAITTLFSIVNSVLFEPLGFAHEDRLYSVVNVPPPNSGTSRLWHVNARHVHEWRAHCTSCEEVAMAESVAMNLMGGSEPERVPALRVSYNFFRALGVRPAVGRDFQPEEELPPNFRKVILADSFWRSRFAADAGIIGRALHINGEPYTVVGVMPDDFRLPVGNQWGPGDSTAMAQPLMFRPLGTDVSQARGAGNNNFVGIVRIKRGVTAEQALSELNALIAVFVKQFDIQLTMKLLRLHPTVTQHAQAGLWLLFGIAIVVWLIVCTNVANLILVRTAGRDREAGIRLALGSSRAELFRLVLNEAFILVAIGSCAGLFLAYLALQAFIARAPADLPRVDDIEMSSRTWMVVVVTAAVSTLICGMFPAWRLTRRNPQASLKEGVSTATATGRKIRLRELMLATEVGLSTVLLVIGVLLTISFLNALRAPTGFNVAHVITQDVSLTIAKFKDPDRIRFVDEAIARLSILPGVRAAAVTNQTPLRGESWICGIADASRPGKLEEVAVANFRFVSSGYWNALGIPLRKGRLLQATDRGQLVAVVGEGVAQLLWPGANPIGKRMAGCNGPQVLEVIGVVGDVRTTLEREPPYTVYQPHSTSPLTRPFFVVRTDADAIATADRVRAAIRSVDADVPISRTISMQEVLDDAVALRRFQMNLVMAFATVALLLAAVGIYGVVSFTVVQTMPEIGIRMALGAHRMEILAMIVRRGLLPVAAGLVLGMAGAIVTSRAISSQLYGVMPSGIVTLAAVGALLMLVSVCACWIPARRATRISPLQALRSE
jgi:putative ABC transport system permease protein